MSEPEKKRVNPNYEASAVCLSNPPQVLADLNLIKEITLDIALIKEKIRACIPADLTGALLAAEKTLAGANTNIRNDIDAYGSYQNQETGEYALKQKRETINYKAELVRCYAPSRVASFVIIESVDSNAMESMLKVRQLTPEVAKQCGEVKETYAYIIK